MEKVGISIRDILEGVPEFLLIKGNFSIRWNLLITQIAHKCKKLPFSALELVFLLLKFRKVSINSRKSNLMINKSFIVNMAQEILIIIILKINTYHTNFTVFFNTAISYIVIANFISKMFQ